MVNRFISIFFWSFALLIGVVMMPLAVVVWALTAPWDTRRAVMHRFTCFWGSLYTWFNPLWSVRVEGRQNIQKGATYVMVANHASAADILVLYRLFRHFKWVSKIENFRVPIVGWNMRLNRYIPLRRGDKTSVLKMLDSCRRELATGSSVMMFPEGTRSQTNDLRPFKPGAFDLAKSVGVPILPVVLQGTRQALPTHGLTCGRADIVVRVLPAIRPASFANTTPQDLADEVRSRFSADLSAHAG